MTEQKAREHLEDLRWPDGPRCVHCKSDRVALMPPLVDKRRSKKREGVYRCKDCRKQFTVTVNTILSGTHLSMVRILKFFEALDSENQVVLRASKKAGIYYKTAYRIVKQMKENSYVGLEDVLQGNNCVEYFIRFADLMLGRQHADDELRAGVILLAHVFKRLRYLDDMIAFTGYDPDFVKDVAINFSKNRLWWPGFILEADSWLCCLEDDKDDKETYGKTVVGFALHTLCGLGHIERTWEDENDEALYGLPKGAKN